MLQRAGIHAGLGHRLARSEIAILAERGDADDADVANRAGEERTFRDLLPAGSLRVGEPRRRATLGVFGLRAGVARHRDAVDTALPGNERGRWRRRTEANLDMRVVERVDQFGDDQRRLDVAGRLAEHLADLAVGAREIDAALVDLPVEIGIALGEAQLDVLEIRQPWSGIEGGRCGGGGRGRRGCENGGYGERSKRESACHSQLIQLSRLAGKLVL